VGGIRYQIRDGVNGYLVSSVEEAADRIVQVVKDPDLRSRLGREAHESVRQNFLITRSIEQDLDLINAFIPEFRLSDAVKQYE
jgi:trehalose synthase